MQLHLSTQQNSFFPTVHLPSSIFQYTYIDNNVFDVRNIDLPKKVVYRKRKEHKVLTKFEYKYRQGRNIEDFNNFMEANPDLPVVEMDTVKGRRGKNKVLLTMIFRNTSFMLIFLMPNVTQKSVLAVFDHLTSLLGLETFRKLFPVILTDNSVEFKDPEALEYSSNGCPRTRLFIVILRHPSRNRRLKTIIV